MNRDAAWQRARIRRLKYEHFVKVAAPLFQETRRLLAEAEKKSQ